ncbi:myb-related transcription factor, partner of profilin-like [Ambystoma mexicanum]|uniref:myb-related transcription factor, partner of profilin-like n=1 Tax=Ambystoma mexicanum TaxID=8296 RepID=UPI0037E7314B
MPKAPKKRSARLRKERFSQDELQMLVDTLHEHAGTVFKSNLRREAVLRKKEIWALVGQKVSAVGNTPRTVKDGRKRWDDLRLKVQNILSVNRTQALETGGGPSSPIKLTPWEETCASMIGPESIEGVGEMGCGATTSADAEESSVAGEVAALAPLNIEDSPDDIWGTIEDDSVDVVHTPTQLASPQASMSDTVDTNTPEQAGQDHTQGHISPVLSPREDEQAGHASQIPSTATGSATGAQRADQHTALIQELVQDNRQAREESRTELRALGQSITNNMNHLCEVLGRIADDLEAGLPAQQPQHEATPSTSSSTQTSLFRRSVRALHRRDMPPPGSGSAE